MPRLRPVSSISLNLPVALRFAKLLFLPVSISSRLVVLLFRLVVFFADFRAVFFAISPPWPGRLTVPAFKFVELVASCGRSCDEKASPVPNREARQKFVAGRKQCNNTLRASPEAFEERSRHVSYSWSVRVRTESRKTACVLARNHSFRVGPALSFEPSDELPSGLELLLGALAADLLTTFLTVARQLRVAVDATELVLTCRLDNPLVHLGVIGEAGTPAIESIDGVFYVSAEAADSDLELTWARTLSRSPIFATLSRAARLEIRFQPTA